MHCSWVVFKLDKRLFVSAQKTFKSSENFINSIRDGAFDFSSLISNLNPSPFHERLGMRKAMMTHAHSLRNKYFRFSFSVFSRVFFSFFLEHFFPYPIVSRKNRRDQFPVVRIFLSRKSEKYDNVWYHFKFLQLPFVMSKALWDKRERNGAIISRSFACLCNFLCSGCRWWCLVSQRDKENTRKRIFYNKARMEP